MNRAWTLSGALCGLAILALAVGADAKGKGGKKKNKARAFNRVATFPVYENSSVNLETAAEIIAASKDGKTLIYTDSELNRVGFISLKNTDAPKADGTIELDGEPTSVAVVGKYALVGVNTSVDFINTSGHLAVVDIEKREIVAEVDLGGQPDSVAVSPDNQYCAVAIENERDEDLGDGEPGQMPAGFLQVIELKGKPSKWEACKVDLTGLADADRFPEDPEPEFVDINKDNICVVTLQENNHIVLVDLESKEVVNDFSAGSVDLDDIDTQEDDQILLADSQEDRLREPDAVKWIDDKCFVIANEGDLDGGSRGFTIFDTKGKVLYESGNTFDHLGVSLGHYPEDRSGNKGTEPEGVEVGKFKGDTLLFVGSERGNYVAVYRLEGKKKTPVYLQALPCTNGPEGLLAIPQRGLFVVASEVDDPDEGIRSTVQVYELDKKAPTYPSICSGDDEKGLPIPWGALSGLAADRDDADTLYAVTDSFYVARPRILELDVSKKPAKIVDEIVITIDGDVADNYDLEGIVQREDGGFWIVSEGRANGSRLNLLVRVNNLGEVQEEIELPAAVQALKTNNGFEGVAVIEDGGNEYVYVAIQREWSGDGAGNIRVGKYDVANDAWTFAYYPKSAPTSPAGGWVGLSEIVALDKDTLGFIERDNQRGPNATIKWLTKASIKGVTFVAEGGSFPTLTKSKIRDLLPDLNATNGWTQDKPEGFAVATDGTAYVVTDNDGVDDATGETILIRIAK